MHDWGCPVIHVKIISVQFLHVNQFFAQLAELRVVITSQKLSVCVSVCALTMAAQVIPLHVKTCNPARTDLLVDSDCKAKTRSV